MQFFIGLHILFEFFVPLFQHNPLFFFFFGIQKVRDSRSEPLQKQKKWFVAVNHRDKGKFLCHSESLRQRTISSQWTTEMKKKSFIATKENSYVTVNHWDKEKYFLLLRKKNNYLKKQKKNAHKMGIKTEKSMSNQEEKKCVLKNIVSYIAYIYYTKD